MRPRRAQQFFRVAALFLGILLLLPLINFGDYDTPEDVTPPLVVENRESPPTRSLEPSKVQAGFADPTDEDRALLEELTAANSIASVLERHTSKRIVCDIFYRTKTVASFTHYADAHTCACIRETADYGILLGDRLHLEHLPGQPALTQTFYADEDAYRRELTDALAEVSLTLQPFETLTGVMKLEETCHMTTEISDADWLRELLEQDGQMVESDGWYEYTEGLTLCLTYVFDNATKDLLHLTAMLREADGTETYYLIQICSYDVKLDRETPFFAPYFEAMEARDYTMLTLVFLPGTETEIRITCPFLENLPFQVFFRGDWYRGSLYTDPACTEVYQGSETRRDELTLYIPARD